MSWLHNFIYKMIKEIACFIQRKTVIFLWLLLILYVLNTNNGCKMITDSPEENESKESGSYSLDEPKNNNNHNKAFIFAIGGGKGGVGKTVIAASIGVGLAMLKKRTVIVDADFGGANLHTVMGFEKPEKTFLNFYNQDCKNLSDILLEYPNLSNLKIMSGAIGTLGMANLSHFHKLRFIRRLRKIDADFIILDLGAGSSYNVLDLFLAADQGIVIVNPEPMSILEGYNFIKQVLFRQVAQTIRNHHNDTTELIRRISQTETHRNNSTVEDLINQITDMDHGLGEKITIFLSQFHPLLLTNMLVETKEENNVLAIKSAAQELLSTKIEYIGAVHNDETVRTSIQKMIPFISYDSKCQASKDLIHIITAKLLHIGTLQSIGAKHTIHKVGKTRLELQKTDYICSVNCLYWEDCEFKKGGLPCEIRHYIGISGFQKE